MRAREHAEELLINIKGSKTDQLNVGCTRKQYATGEVLCPVEACEPFGKHFPQRLRGSEASRPIMRWSDSTYVKRDELQKYLEVATISAGRNPAEVGPHSRPNRRCDGALSCVR